MRAHPTLPPAGLVVHDGNPEHGCSLDHTAEIEFIEDAMKLALEPLA